MGLKELAQKAARSLYYTKLGTTLRERSKKALSKYESIASSAADDSDTNHSKTLSRLEELAIKADLKFSNMAAGDSKLLESAEDYTHLSHMIHMVHSSDAKSARESYKNLMDTAFVNTEYSIKCETEGKRVRRPTSYAPADGFFAVALSGSGKGNRPGTCDAGAVARAVDYLNTEMGLSLREIGRENIDTYARKAYQDIKSAVKDKVESHWLFQDSSEQLDAWVERKGEKLGKNKTQVDYQMEILRNKAVNRIVEDYMDRRTKEHDSSIFMKHTNHGLTQDNQFGIYLTGGEIEQAFERCMIESPSLQKAVYKKPSFIKEVAFAVLNAPTTLLDFVKYGPSYHSQAMARMNRR
ncbi:MAG: hypothetical protein KKE20_04810 [Nanoarchaeota archaeon]|nr:hypothetical protein [Nanoarchaeota archaeon]